MSNQKNPFRVIVAGGRDFSDYEYLRSSLDFLLQNITGPIVIVSGTAKGADKLGEQYAAEKGYAVLRFPADWDRFGKAAGYMRNEQMAKNADVLVAFWDGTSKGTKNIIQLAKRYDLKIRVQKY